MRQLLAFRDSFDPLLQEYLRNKIVSYAGIAKDDFVSDILGYSNDIAFEGGKRIRPYLASVGYSMVRDHVPASVTRIFFALELFHIFALIHDDIMDQGMSRHGIPTTHVYVAHALKKRKRVGNLLRSGESQAILLGDLLLTWSNEIMSVSHRGVPETALRKARELFFRMIDDVVVGQMLDVDLMTRTHASLEMIERKMRLKTASYTFIKPLQIGATLAGSGPRLLPSLERIGEALGLAFQIQDDLLDLTVRPKELLKTVFSDLADRQHTVFTFHISEHGSAAQRRELRDLFGARLTENDRPRVTKLFLETGAIAYGRGLIDIYFSDAKREIERLDLSKKLREELGDFIEYLEHRSY